MSLNATTETIWRKAAPQKNNYPSLTGEHSADVVVIGGGITGLTSAMLLKNAGKKVILLEQGQLGEGTTGSTSAHLTAVVDSRYSAISKSFGIGTARRVARSMMSAIDKIEKIQADLGIDCDFKRVPGYFYTENEKDVAAVKEEFQATKKVGLPVHLEEKAPLPFPTLSAFRTDDQAQLQPLSYIYGIAREIDGEGSSIFENSKVKEVRDGEPCVVYTENGHVRADDVVMATHIPIGFNVLQTELQNYRSFILTARVAGQIPEGLYWDTEDPYHYIRSYMRNDEQLLVFGGKDHKVGLASSQESFARLEDYVRHHFDVIAIEAKWSAQFHDPTDGLPYIGKSPFSQHVYIGTGYSGDGLTFGTLAAMTISNLIVHGYDEYDDMYQPARLNFSAAQNILKKNFDVARYFITDRIKVRTTKDVEGLKPGEACVIRNGRSYLAVYRSESGEIKSLSAVCSHMKCIVHWNDAEKTWDCPCHASRFNVDGERIDGPAIEGLKKLDWQSIS